MPIFSTCKVCGAETKSLPSRPKLFCSNTCSATWRFSDQNPNQLAEKEVRRKHAIKNEFGGQNSKTKIWYTKKNGERVHLQSSYERRVAESLDENDVEWTRPSFLRWVDEDGKSHRYYPDFYIPSLDLYVDPKNDFLLKQDADKIKRVCEQTGKKVIMLSKDQLFWDAIQNMPR